MTALKTFENVPIRIVNIPSGMTIDGLQSSGLLSRRVSLTVSGNKNILDHVADSDVEVIVDATDRTGEWQVSISKKNLVSLSPDIDLSQGIVRVLPCRLNLRLTRLLTERVPVTVTYPAGEAPLNYQFLDIWPYHLTLSLSGPEEVITQLKSKGLNLTFNLNQISRVDLDSLFQSKRGGKSDEISFSIPNEWKKISIPALSDRPFQIDDPQAQLLRIDFIRSETHPIGKAIPLSLFYPPEYSLTLNPETYSLSQNSLIQVIHGIPMIRKSLYAKGVSRLFAELIQDMIEVSVVMSPKSEKQYLDWSIQFINPRVIEDKYVSMLISDSAEEDNDLINVTKREEYYRNRFRNYMHRFQLYKSNQEKFDLKIELKQNLVSIIEEAPKS
jgi:hypothetical protein